MDLRWVCCAYSKINSLLDEREANPAETHFCDLFGLSRFLNRKGETGRAHSGCLKATDAGLPAGVAPVRDARDGTAGKKSRRLATGATQLVQEIVSDPKGTASLRASNSRCITVVSQERFPKRLGICLQVASRVGVSGTNTQVARPNLLEEKFVMSHSTPARQVGRRTSLVMS